MIRRIVHWVALLHGWPRAGVAFLAGALGALAMPPFGFFPALAVSFTLAIWLLDGAVGPRGQIGPALRQAFSIGWSFGFGYFLAGLWWIGSAFLVDADRFVWLMPFAVLALPAGLALFHGLGFLIARLIWPTHAVRILSFAMAMAVVEYARGHVLTGFPWNAFGYALADQLTLAQGLSVFGLPSLTLLTVAILASPASLADEGPGRIRAPALGLVALAALALFGTIRLSGDPPALVEGVKLRLMQPSIPQDDKFRPAARDSILATYLALSRRSTGPNQDGLNGITHLIWPESAFPFIVSRDAEALAEISVMLSPATVLLTGAGRAEDPQPGETRRSYFNAVHIIDPTGAILDTYDKLHLVPFGEYLPFQSALESWGLRQLTQLQGGFTPGNRRRTLAVPNAPPVGILICYEAIFPGEVIDPANRPGWLLNVTNDAWFGQTPGPYQHLEQARARAIEEGLPLVRAANTGISAVFDGKGRTVALLPIGATGVLDSRLPVAEPATIYSRIRDWPLLIMLVCCGLYLATVMRRLRQF